MSEPEPAVKTYRIRLCDLCIAGTGGECHVPGCALFLKAASLTIVLDLLLMHVLSVGIVGVSFAALCLTYSVSRRPGL